MAGRLSISGIQTPPTGADRSLSGYKITGRDDDEVSVEQVALEAGDNTVEIPPAATACVVDLPHVESSPPPPPSLSRARLATPASPSRSPIRSYSPSMTLRRTVSSSRSGTGISRPTP